MARIVRGKALCLDCAIMCTYEVPRTRYLIPYRVRRGVVEILRVFHASRRPRKRW